MCIGGGGVGSPVPPSGYVHEDPNLSAPNFLLETVADPVCVWGGGRLNHL